MEAILIIYTGSSIATGIRLALVNLVFTLRPWKEEKFIVRFISEFENLL